MKKVLAAILASVMAISMAACASGPAQTTSSKGSEASSQGGQGGEEKNLSGTVVYWSMWQETEPQADILKNAIAEFETANSGVKVEVEWQGRGVRDLVAPAIASGQQVDLFDSDPLVFYRSDPSILLDLSDFYTSEGQNGKPESENLLKGLVDWDKSMSAEYADGGYHSVPYAPYTMSWYYNTEMFKDAGITELPETWEELDAVCAKLKEAGYEPIVVDDAYYNMVFCMYLAREMGPQAVKDMVAEGGDAFNNPAILNTLKAIEDFAKKGYFAKSCKTNKYPAGQQQFARKEAAMYYNASFMASENAETAGDNFPYGHFPFTTVPGGKGLITENTVGGQAFCVSAKTENKDAVYELLHYFVGNKCQTEFNAKGLVPCTNDVAWPAAVAQQKEIVNSLTANVDWAAGWGGDFCEGVGNPEIIKVMFGETTAQQAFDKIVEEAKNFKK